MQTIVVDASVFLCSFLDYEVNSNMSRNFFKCIKKTGIKVTVPILTLFEVLHSFYRVTNSVQKTENVHSFFINLNMAKDLKILSLDASFLAYFFTYHKHFDLKTSDTVVALSALREKCPLISWDKQLLKQASKGVEAYTPEEYLKLIS